jgi:hypothetical protein
MENANNIKDDANKRDKFIKRVTEYMAENDKVLKKFKIKPQPSISFPFHRHLPILSRICLWIVRKQGGILDTQFKDDTKK